MKDCNPSIRMVEGQICEYVLICQRCGFCLVHCICPPADQRGTDDKFRRVTKRGALVVELT